MALCVRPRLRSNWMNRIPTLPAKGESNETFKPSPPPGGRDSSSSRTDLNPYMIEDQAMTVGELESARDNVPMVLVSRELRSQ
jgi:hypothetical protein